jgi:uncharacterized membrane protein/glutaredoxin
MGRKANAKREPRSSRSSSNTSVFGGPPDVPLLALSLIGAVLAGYLSWTAFVGAAVQGCAVGGGCDVVLSSRWATLMGLPTAFWGLLTYLGLAATALMADTHKRWRLGWMLAFMGVLYSIYLTGVSLFILGGACPYCLTSLALMLAIFGWVSIQRPATLSPFDWPSWLKVRGAVAVGLIVFLHLNYTGVIGKAPQEEDPTLRALAIHLAEQGVKMYGADWCPHCQDQKALFGAAAKRLPYIECALGRAGGQTQECRDAGITNYPTWDIKGQRYVEVLSPIRLAELTGFDLAAAGKAAATP